jgi:hypothetical protein
MYEGVFWTRMVIDRVLWLVIVASSVRKLWEDFSPDGPIVTNAEVVTTSTMQMYVFVLWDVLFASN